VNLSVRIFLGYFLLLGLAIWFVMRTFTAELVPGMRQSIEEVLIDTANLLAEIVQKDVAEGVAGTGDFATAVNAFGARKLNARIWFLKKRDPSLVVYLTDAKGIVLFDSRGHDEGKDYSQWNDVYLTLRGEYGARSTREAPDDAYSSLMYVAAPIRHKGEIIGVLTVGKPSLVVQPFVQQAIRNIEEKGVLLVLGALALGMLITYWLTFSIRRLTTYARAIQAGKRVQPPRLRESELAHLADAMETMRAELEGKDYVENYLHTLTHELKSPLASIRGAAELLDEEMPLADRQRFIGNIRNETLRLQQVVEQLLNLAMLEKRQGLENIEQVNVNALLRQLCHDKQPLAETRGISFTFNLNTESTVPAERFLLQQAVSNLLDNAIAFTPDRSTIALSTQERDGMMGIVIADNGPGIPDYALDRVFERFYSLPRPGDGPRSSGLGLSLVHEVAQLHGGSIRLNNRPDGGSEAVLSLPLVQKSPSAN
jgi:two-component system, OmpR family, sensor histidine kinase CreC